MERKPIIRKTYLKRPKLASKPLKRKDVVKVPKKKTARQMRLSKDLALKREWLVPENSGPMRYAGLRGIYWYWLSRDVRKKEWDKYGVCITCLEPIEDWRVNCDCGHILASSFCGEYLRLNPINLTIQHKKCNNPRFSPHAGVANALNIDKRHGVGYMENLYSLRKKEAKCPTTNEYKELIRNLDSYKQTVEKLNS